MSVSSCSFRRRCITDDVGSNTTLFRWHYLPYVSTSIGRAKLTCKPINWWWEAVNIILALPPIVTLVNVIRSWSYYVVVKMALIALIHVMTVLTSTICGTSDEQGNNGKTVYHCSLISTDIVHKLHRRYYCVQNTIKHEFLLQIVSICRYLQCFGLSDRSTRPIRKPSVHLYHSLMFYCSWNTINGVFCAIDCACRTHYCVIWLLRFTDLKAFAQRTVTTSH